MEETPTSKSAVSTFFMRLSQRYQLLLGNRSDKKCRNDFLLNCGSGRRKWDIEVSCITHDE